MPGADYIRVHHAEPHASRGRQLLAAHPELRALAGPAPQSAVWIVALVTAQLAVAVALTGTRWFVWLPCAYVIGATIDHALWVLIHECTHHLVVRSRRGNRLFAIVANLPIVVPSAISFGKYHMLHHRHLGEIGFDADVPGPIESRLVGHSSVAKTVWMSALAFVQGAIRPRRLKRLKTVDFLDAWTVINIVVQLGFLAAIVWWRGVEPLKYLTASTLLALGIHPLGARWIQEHFVFAPGQETYSYYGPLNRLCFNMGYHNEHHDLVTIPWTRLPEIRRIAPEFYDRLYAHRSWTSLMFRFLFDRDVTLFNRVVRPDRAHE